jgi:hypothetical protein
MSRIAGHGRHFAAAVTAALALAACVGTAPSAQASTATAAGPTWTAETTPVDSGNLTGAEHLDEHTTWATGTRFSTTDPDRPLLLSRDDRDGQGWREVPSPGDALAGSWYNSVSASSSQDVWLTAGSTDSGSVPTAHWDGSQWQTAQAPVPPHDGNAALHVAAVSATDAWAAGWYWLDDGTGTQTLHATLDHWDGSAWTSAALPDGADVANLIAVTATSPDDVWAVGNSSEDQAVALHYDGSSWKQVTDLPISGLYAELRGIAANGPDDVWAVGRVLTSESDTGHALVMHWDGSSWKQVKAPSQAGPLSSVAVTPSGIVAVGMDHDQANGIALNSTAGNLTMQTLSRAGGASFVPTAVDTVGDCVTVVGSVFADGAALPTPVVLTSSS